MLKHGSRISFIAKRCSLSRLYSNTQVYTPPEFNDLTVGKWGKMSKPIQEEIAEYLEWRMEGAWQDLDLNEVQAAYFISYGAWGPRAPPGSKEAQMQMSGSEIIVRGIASMVIFTALSVCIMNYKRDKDVNTLLQELENNVAFNIKHE